MTQRLLIAGGYGIVGSTIAQHVRKINKDVEIVLAGRNPDRGTAQAIELSNATSAYLDLENNFGLDNLGDINARCLEIRRILQPDQFD
ncbi:hypothetical protein [Cohnella herbarum]|uniref:Saccharopine dehydrogenase NADP binding domain-containing protein n=1 Tax=Cohnella herbarum TaxID=2728023 RepID=A0A7Z2VNK0_9BACL|nr:hypothetical protein [Cohnella herbarum]QJD86266.1 hypothetical protein HH215_25930 [Cohnella herbarum]